VLDPHNPRSVAYQVERLKEHLDEVPRLEMQGRTGQLERKLSRLVVDLATTDAANVEADFLPEVSSQLMMISEAISERYFTGIGAAIHPLETLA
jgi:uncharacterized alpha-E superfamily protein